MMKKNSLQNNLLAEGMTSSDMIPRLPKKMMKKTSSLREVSALAQENLDERACKQIIRDMNLKVTDQRMQILQTLHEGRRHVTAQEVYELVIEKFPEVGFATVYRFLRELVEHEIVTEVRMGGQPARYELTPRAHHDHLTCIKCSKICEFENDEIEALQEKVAQKFGFRLTSHVLELYGICTDCQRSESRP